MARNECVLQCHLIRSLNMRPTCTIISSKTWILFFCFLSSCGSFLRCDALSFLNSNGSVAHWKFSTSNLLLHKKTSLFVRNDFSTHSLSFVYTWSSACCKREVFRRKSTLTMMGKGDGKKKRKKKSSNGTSTPAPVQPAASSPPPQRVTSDSNISVRRQIQWARMKKEISSSGSSFRQLNVKRTAYRKSLDEKEIEEAKISRAKRGQEPDWDVILNATASSPLVIVDAYNVIHKWPRLKKWMNKGMISKARDMLIHDMEELRALKGWRIEVVFDGYGRAVNGPLGDGPGSKIIRERISKSDQQASKDVTVNGVRVVYSGAGTSADGYIEKRCFDAKQVTDGKLTGSLIVASNDNMIRNAASNAGALCMSAERMVDELKALRKATMYRVEVAVAKVNGRDVRPAKLLGKPLPTMFVGGSGNVIIEDKRNKARRKVQKKDETEHSKTLEDLRKGTTSIPSWAVMPPKKNDNII